LFNTIFFFVFINKNHIDIAAIISFSSEAIGYFWTGYELVAYLYKYH